MAIAFDATAKSSGGAVASVTYAHTCTGSNRLLLVGGVVVETNAVTITGATYNGVAMTALYNYAPAGVGSRLVAMFYLIAPATGANNVVFSLSGATNFGLAVASMSYTGVSQSGFPDANAKTDTAPTSHSSMTQAVTTILDNCWAAGFYWEEENCAATISGAGAVRADQQASGVGDHIYGVDTNAVKTPAGSVSVAVTISPSATNYFSTMLASFAPAPQALTARSFTKLQAVNRASTY